MRHFLESTKGAQKEGMYTGCPQEDWISGREEAEQRVKDLNKPQRRKLCLSKAARRPTSLQSVCCHQEKWRSVHSHADKKDVTARWDVLHAKGFSCFSPFAVLLAARFAQRWTTASLLRCTSFLESIFSENLCNSRTSSILFPFSLFLCVCVCVCVKKLLFWGRKWCNVSLEVRSNKPQKFSINYLVCHCPCSLTTSVLLLLSLWTVHCGGCDFDWEGVKNLKTTIDSNPTGFVSPNTFTPNPHPSCLLPPNPPFWACDPFIVPGVYQRAKASACSS